MPLDAKLHARASARIKVLLVDDDPAVRASLGRALQTEDYEVFCAANGEEALQEFFRGYIDLVLLDINMPVKNGWDTFERMTAVNPFLPIIITARPNQQELATVAGATAIMEKPLVIPVLIETMNRLVEESIEARWRWIAHHRATRLSARAPACQP
jgi:CheY-like chemotaxis protein